MTDQEVNGVTVLEIEGRIVLGEESNAFREKVKEPAGRGQEKDRAESRECRLYR
jgi:hypothetical protein